MKLFSKKTILTSMFLTLIICFSFLLPGFIYSKNNISTRDINVNEIGTLSYEEKAQQLLNDFDVYSYDIDSSTVTFTGNFTKDLKAFSALTFLSTCENLPVTQKFSTKFDMQTGKFSVVTSYYQNDVLISSDEKECIPYFDEEKNDYFIKLDNGDLISVSENLNVENMDNCIALVDDVAILLAAALAITIVASAPSIAYAVTTVVTTVVSWVSSFFWWLKSLFVKTVVTTTVVQVLTPCITIQNTTYKTKAVTDSELKLLNPNFYFAAFGDPTNGKMYLSLCPISEQMAVAILNIPIVVQCIGDPSRQMVASTYTFTEYGALRVASVVGLAARTPAWYPEKHGGIGYFAHYHTISIAVTIGKKNVKNYSNPHSFFGTSL